MRKSIKKILGLMIIGTTLSILPLVGASAEWRQDSNGSWWYSTGTSWVTGWSQIEGKWYYFDNSGYMKTGWVQDGTTWYYLQQDGSMAVNTTTPDGYEVGSNGAWVTTNTPISTNTSVTTTLPSTATDTNTVNTPTNTTSTNSTSSSSSSSSKSKTNVSIFYRLDGLQVTRMIGGKQSLKSYYGDDLSKKAEVEATYGMIIVDSKDYNESAEGLMDKVMADKEYKLVNDGGTIKLVKNTSESNSGSSNNDSNNSNDSNDSEVITTPPETTTGSAVTVTTSSAVSYTV